ncbi:MAG: hypothetical protein HY402_03850 [Elusimicrobia bacterium]|nr:hypothetical protein [Elusimicrobiota bacterium]
MRLLQRYFTPFAVLLVLSAVIFARPQPGPIYGSIGVLAVSLLGNELLARYAYRWIGWTRFLQRLHIWMHFFWSLPLFYLLGPIWGPMWLLFLFTPAAAALSSTRRMTWIAATASAGTLLGFYASRGLSGTVFWGQALVHAAFILFFSLFVRALAEMTMKLRDSF